MHFIKIFIMTSVILVISCSVADAQIEDRIDCSNKSTLDKYNVSLIQLIATPDKFNKKCVHVIGVMSSIQGDIALFVTKDDAVMDIKRNSIQLVIKNFNRKELEKFSGLHYRVIGYFEANKMEDSLYNGSITNIHYLNMH